MFRKSQVLQNLFCLKPDIFSAYIILRKLKDKFIHDIQKAKKQ